MSCADHDTGRPARAALAASWASSSRRTRSASLQGRGLMRPSSRSPAATRNPAPMRAEIKISRCGRAPMTGERFGVGGIGDDGALPVTRARWPSRLDLRRWHGWQAAAQLSSSSRPHSASGITGRRNHDLCVKLRLWMAPALLPSEQDLAGGKPARSCVTSRTLQLQHADSGCILMHYCIRLQSGLRCVLRPPREESEQR